MVSFIKVLSKIYVSTDSVKMMPQAQTLSIYALCITGVRRGTNDCWYFHINFWNKYRAMAWYWPLGLAGAFLFSFFICCELQRKSEWSWQSPIILSCSTHSLCLNEAPYFLCSLKPSQRSCISISRWETVQRCWPRKLTGCVYIYLLCLSFPLVRGVSLVLLLLHSSFSGSWHGPKRKLEWKICLRFKVLYKNNRQTQMSQIFITASSGLNYGTNLHLKNLHSYI